MVWRKSDVNRDQNINDDRDVVRRVAALPLQLERARERSCQDFIWRDDPASHQSFKPIAIDTTSKRSSHIQLRVGGLQ